MRSRVPAHGSWCPPWAGSAGFAAPTPLGFRVLTLCRFGRVEGALGFVGRELAEKDLLHCFVDSREDHARGEGLDLFAAHVAGGLDLPGRSVLALTHLGGEEHHSEQ